MQTTTINPQDYMTGYDKGKADALGKRPSANPHKVEEEPTQHSGYEDGYYDHKFKCT